MIKAAVAIEESNYRQGGVFDYISPSRLSLWAKCPLAFKLKYVDGIRVPTNFNMFLGHRVHAGLEVFYRHRQLGSTLDVEQVHQHLAHTWDEAVEDQQMKFETVAEATQLKQKADSLVKTYIRQVPDDEPRPMAVETRLETSLADPLTGEDLGIPLVGIVDLVLRADAGATIIDFKTASRGGELTEIAHEIQLSCYAYAFRQCTGEKESELQIRRLVKTKIDVISFVYSMPQRRRSSCAASRSSRNVITTHSWPPDTSARESSAKKSGWRVMVSSMSSPMIIKQFLHNEIRE